MRESWNFGSNLAEEKTPKKRTHKEIEEANNAQAVKPVGNGNEFGN